MAAEVHVEDLGRLADEVVVNGEDVQATGLERADYGIHLIGQQHQVAHRHDVALWAGLEEPRPGP